MNNNIILDKVLSVIDEIILLDHDLDHDEIVKKIYIETKYTDQDFNKFLAVITVGKLTLGKYIRERSDVRVWFAVCHENRLYGATGKHYINAKRRNSGQNHF